MSHGWILVVAALVVCSCGSGSGTGAEPRFAPQLAAFADGLVSGNPDGRCEVPAAALPTSIAKPDRVVGAGTRSSCTEAAFRAAVAHGGTIVFDCGPDTITIVLDQSAKVFNDSLPDVVIDGGGKVTLSGGGRDRILYMNTCDPAQHWTSEHCDNQPTPRLVVQNLSFVDGDAEAAGQGGTGGGGAIYASGGSLKVVNCRFFRNVCAKTGADVGGGAIRAFQQYGQAPVQVVNSTFGSIDNGNVGSNGGALSSIMVNWSVWNSLFVGNEAVGDGGNPAEAGTPGGGSGGAIYNDGNTLTLSVCGSVFAANRVNAYGAAIFFVSNNHDGTLNLADTRISGNLGGSWHVLPGISMHEDTRRNVSNSVLEN
jgi:hypothetical protein